MESLKLLQDYLNNIQNQAEMLAQAVVSLNKSFQNEADHLAREQGVQCLKMCHATVIKDLEQARRLEGILSYENSKNELKLSFAGLAVRFITAAITENQKVRNSVNQFFDRSKRNKRPYGTVMVCIGVKWIPDDVRVVSISELAREANRLESEVIQQLQQTGSQVFTESAFSSFIDKLVADIREGRLHLPLTGEKLSKIAEPYCLAFAVKLSKWVAISQPQRPTSIFRSK